MSNLSISQHSNADVQELYSKSNTKRTMFMLLILEDRIEEKKIFISVATTKENINGKLFMSR